MKNLFLAIVFTFSTGISANNCQFSPGAVMAAQEYAYCLTWHGLGTATLAEMVVSFDTPDATLLRMKEILDEIAEEDGICVVGDFLDYLTELRASL